MGSQQPEDWGPIILLNNDFRILASTFAQRLVKMSGDTLHINQVCLIKKKDVSVIILLLSEMYCNMQIVKKIPLC